MTEHRLCFLAVDLTDILLQHCSFLLTRRGYCWALKRILGSDKSLNSPLQRGYEF